MTSDRWRGFPFWIKTKLTKQEFVLQKLQLFMQRTVNRCALHFRLSEMDMQSTTILCKYVTHTYALTYFKFVGRFAAIAYLFKYFEYAER